MTDVVAGALIALNSKAGATPGQWIQLLASGPNRGRDGRGPFEVKDPEAVILNSLASVAGGILPIDINHAIDKLAPAGLPSAASGWITKLEWRKNGLFGYAEWTPPAAKALQNKEYRFISPALQSDGKGTVLAVVRASLVNDPNLDLIALNSAERGNGQDTMSANFLPELRRLLGASDAADETQILAQLRERLTSIHSADPAKYVPIELFQKTVKELHLRNNGMARADAEAVVEVAEQNMMLMPYMKEWAIELCMRDRKAYDDFIVGAGGQQINTFLKTLTAQSKYRELQLQARERERFRVGDGGSEAAADEIARNLGHSADDVKKFGGNV